VLLTFPFTEVVVKGSGLLVILEGDQGLLCLLLKIKEVDETPARLLLRELS
jgi:hypothetical protein